MLRVTVTALACFVGFASAQPSHISPNYLALGDSLASGYNPLIQPPDPSKYVGYPLILSNIVNLNLANASCPGETSGTFAGTSTKYLPGFDCTRSDGNSQLGYAVKWLRANRSVGLVTLNIGGNDLALCAFDP